ncbi:hypothetical protein O1611_g3263 [Lasiodiplodia mahajangana]|uniref:Uncharacterized protein n=1 Tax=Lasiodiplodia mahajangana TaxID=1108764 RepID=A0ACC2JS92_9PEZI|nr:hypothetical protein O1611_g3263 [Lasiodiplodia mahajangana]
MEEPSQSDVVKDLHRDLARKYRTHGARLKQLWPTMGPSQRGMAMKAGTPDNVVLKHSRDASLGNVCKFMPEWNLKDIAAPGSDFLLRMLEHRATTSLEDQYIAGLDGGLGDYELIVNMMRTRNLEHVRSFRDCWTLFMNGDKYGQSYELLKDKEGTLAALKPAIDAGLCVPQSVGELVLLRQIYLLQCLNIMIEDILDVASTTRSQQKPPKKSPDATVAALSKLSIKPSTPKLDLPTLQGLALDQKASLDDTLALVCMEPVVLSHLVNNWFFSRPELVADEKGRRLPAHTDKFVSGAFLDTIHNAVKGAATWNYICRLLELLKTSAGKTQRDIVLQEISNVCHLEYIRVQGILKRQISTGTRWFKRVSNTYDNGNARIILKGKPEALAGADQQLHCVLRLCQTEVTASKAVDWLMKLDELQGKTPLKRDELQGGVIDALGDLAVVVAFIQSLSSAISMPAFSRKKGQRFITGAAELEAELNQVKPELDLCDFAVPIDNLLEPGMAEAALKAFDKFIIEKTGTKIGFLYLDLVDDCIKELREHLEVQAQHEAARETVKEAEYIPFPPEAPREPETRVQERRQKEKTRPAHSSVYEITSNDLEAVAAVQAPPPPKPFKVKSTTAEVFSTLFGKAESRGSVPWVNFEAALAEVGFSVIPKFGSVFTFIPPESMAIQKPLTLHRPHQSRIEGYLLLVFARRLNRLYGWGEETFQVC